MRYLLILYYKQRIKYILVINQTTSDGSCTTIVIIVAYFCIAISKLTQSNYTNNTFGKNMSKPVKHVEEEEDDDEEDDEDFEGLYAAT